MNNPILTHDEEVLAEFKGLRRIMSTNETKAIMDTAIEALQDKKRLDILHEESGIDYRKVADNLIRVVEEQKL